jgi:AcrR family transcriptional regulator
MSTSQEDLRRIALTEFATAGYSATSLQHIAELAGLSKSSVLYHYASKEALLEAAIGPALDRMFDILQQFTQTGLSGENRVAFLEAFVDVLLDHRLEVNLFINQGPSLTDVPVIDRANALVVGIAEFFADTAQTLEEKMRFGIALGGAAYMLCTVTTLDLVEGATREETRAALITIMSDLLTPVSIR